MDGKKSSKNLEPKKTQNGGKYAKEESCSEVLHACLYLCVRMVACWDQITRSLSHSRRGREMGRTEW